MSDNWIVQNLENALKTWNEKLAEIWQLITQSPEQFKGGTIWNVIVGIHGAVQAIGLALLVLFFVVGVMKTCGSFAELKRPEHALKVFIRFALAKAAALKSSAVKLAEPNTEGIYFGDRKLTTVASSSPIIANAIYAYCPGLNPTAILADATQVGSYAFAGAETWRITFSETVNTLGDGVFTGTTALESIDVRPLGVNIPSVTERTFDGLQQSEITLLVTPEYILDWANAPGWRDFKVVGAKGIDDVAANAYSVAYSGGQVTVRSGETLLRVTVYGTDGRILASAAPDACEASLKLDTPDNVVVVTSLTDDGKTYTDKLFIR